MVTDWNIWLERLSNWQFVAAMVGVNVVVYAVVACVLGLTTDLDLRSFITLGVAETAGLTGLFAWKRWK